MSKSSRIQQVLANKGDAIDDTESNAPTESAEVPPADGLTRLERIRLAAYSAAERRGFEPGHEEDDWLEAERQVDAQAQGGQDASAAP